MENAITIAIPASVLSGLLGFLIKWMIEYFKKKNGNNKDQILCDVKDHMTRWEGHNVYYVKSIDGIDKKIEKILENDQKIMDKFLDAFERLQKSIDGLQGNINNLTNAVINLANSKK